LKFSASKTIKAIEDKAETSLTNKSIQLEGTLSHYKGKNVLELTNGADAYLGLSNSTITLPVAQKPLGNKKIRGEIIDPKCFFGVMKPGSGKTHKSCAARCLSGGIPAVAYTADHIQLKGEISQMADWKIIHTSPSSICPLGPKWLFGDMPLCAELQCNLPQYPVYKNAILIF